MEILSRATNYGMTNVGNNHTLPIGRINSVVALICITGCQVIEFARDMMSSPDIGVPIGVNTIGCMVHILVTKGVIVIIFKAPPAVLGGVSFLVSSMKRSGFEFET
jgi:hypothetical protein